MNGLRERLSLLLGGSLVLGLSISAPAQAEQAPREEAREGGAAAPAHQDAPALRGG